MNKIFLDDGAEIEFGSCDSIADLALKVKEKVNKDDVLFIYVNLKFKAGTRAEQKGIELLIWLRLKEVMNHCVLYSFETVHTLLNRKPQYLIVTSIGTSFFQLPVNLDKIDVNQVKDKHAESENLKNCLKSTFSISEFRHREANWWGVKCLWDVHKVSTGGNFKDKYPLKVIENQLVMNNSVAELLYEFEVISIIKYIEKFQFDIRKKANQLPDQINLIKSSQDLNSEEMVTIQQWISETGEKIAEIKNQWLKYFTNTSVEYQKLKTEIDKNLNEIIDFQEEYERLKKDKRNLEEIESEYLIQLNSINRSLENSFQEVRNILFKGIKIPIIDKKTRILLIDDNANNGWADIFNTLFEGVVESVVPSQEFMYNIDELYLHSTQGIKNIILNFKPTLILLDLRLYDETVNSLDTTQLSGTILLSKIKSDFKGLPIIITTASNKIWTYEKLISSGADGYWIKEGLDEKREASESIKNYVELITLVSKASDTKYQDLQCFIEFVETLSHESYLWWEIKNNNKWKNGDVINGNTFLIKKVLNDSINMIKQYLHFSHMGYGNKDKVTDAFHLSGIIQKICSVYEYVHLIDKGTYINCAKIPGGLAAFLSTKRGDKNLNDIRKLRNDAAHAEFESLSWGDLQHAVDKTKSYLTTEPFSTKKRQHL